MQHRSLLVLFLSFAVAPTIGCGSSDVELTDDGGGGGGGTGTDDGGAAGTTDGGLEPVGPCAPENAQCNNCIDDDGDGKIDGDDPECTGALDNDERSFATGIPGDNKDLVKQDCFFDGNSGAGDDGCLFHICCIAPSLCEGPDSVDTKFDATTDCQPSSAECSENCGSVTPPGCDCLGCCTICGESEGTSTCADVAVNPLLYPPECSDSDPDNDPDTCCDSQHLENCFTCEPLDDCGGSTCNDDPTDCVLCPGQTEDDLPAECNDMNECPTGSAPCDTTADCPGGNEYCSTGCCIAGGID